MKKIGLFIGIIVVILGCYFISIYSFSLNENIVGSIEVRENGAEGIELSKEEVSYLVSELDDLKFKISNKDFETTTNVKGYEYAPEKFRIFLLDKKGKELADIRVYDERNIACVKEFNTGYGLGSFNIGYHATNGEFDLEKLSSLSE